MDKQALLNKIAQLEQAAGQMSEPQRTFKLDDISQLKITIESMAVEEIAAKMAAIDLPKLQEVDGNIALEVEASGTESQRIKAFNLAYGLIKGALGLVV
jgi:hypothetical protein